MKAVRIINETTIPQRNKRFKRETFFLRFSYVVRTSVCDAGEKSLAFALKKLF
jgi:hypothetical protein